MILKRILWVALLLIGVVCSVAVGYCFREGHRALGEVIGLLFNSETFFQTASMILARVPLCFLKGAPVMVFFGIVLSKISLSDTKDRDAFFLKLLDNSKGDAYKASIAYLKKMKGSFVLSKMQHQTGRTNSNNKNGRVSPAEISSSQQIVFADLKLREPLRKHFEEIYAAYKNDLISKKQMRQLCDTDAFALLFDVEERMSCYIDENYDYTIYYRLMKLCKEEYRKQS